MNKRLAVTLLFPLVLAACGGGSDDDDDTPETPTNPETPAEPETPPVIDPVTQASLNTAAQLGMAPIAGNSDTVRVYDVVADIGDTWRLTLDMASGAYTLKVLHTVYGLTDASGTFTQSTNGSFITLTGANGAFTLLIDERTRTIVGAMSLGGRTASVSGTSYAVPTDVSVLAGTYGMLLSLREVVPLPAPGELPGNPAHQLIPGVVQLRADATAIVCFQGIGVTPDGKCATFGGDETEPTEGLPAKLTLIPTDGDYQLAGEIEEVAFDFGTLRVQAGDLGPVLTLDLPFDNGIFGSEGDAAGATYLVKQQQLQGNEVDGSWLCTVSGKAETVVTISGTAFSQTRDGETLPATLQYNGVFGGPEAVPFNSLVSVISELPGTPGDEEASPSRALTGIILPMSSSVMLYSQAISSASETSTSICRRNN